MKGIKKMPSIISNACPSLPRQLGENWGKLGREKFSNLRRIALIFFIKEISETSKICTEYLA
jgi:hypothetical protein